MSTSQCATDPELADPSLVQTAALVQTASPVQSASEDSPKRPKGLLIGFAATVTVGLALASWYVGVRIMDANEIAPVSAAVDAHVAPPQVAPAQVAPRPPDMYLQVAALGPRQDASFVKALEAQGYQARIIPGTAEGAASQEDSRILIGPFAGRSFLEEAERNLQSAGVLATEVTY